MAGKKRTTPIRQEYLKERKRVQGLINEIKRRGYNVDSKEILGEIPTRVTQKALEQLTGLETVDDVANEFFDVLKRSIQEAPQTVTTDNLSGDDFYPNEWEIAYAKFIDQFTDVQDATRDLILSWADYSIETFGEEAFLKAVNDAEADGTIWEKSKGYTVEATVEYINDIASRLAKNEAQHKSASEYVKRISTGIDEFETYWSKD